MECDRLKRLIKTWYSHVQDETMAPARMIAFMRQHVAECPTCLSDPFVRPEIEKITAILLPPDKQKNSVDEESAGGAAAKKKEADAVEADAEETTDADESETEENVDDDDDEDDEI